MKTPLVVFVLMSSTAALAEELPSGEEMRARVPWTEPSGHGLAIAYDNGSWGGAWMQSLRFKLPVFEQTSPDGWPLGSFALGVRGLYVDHPDPDRVDLGARFELTGHSPVFLNLVRLYGGGGPQLVRAISSRAEDRRWTWGGGGYFGFEVFMSAGFSFYAEIGGNGGAPLSGATITGGMAFYPF
jgi:hypothetical protein